ncbi:hypothetical protein PLEOSDRAFT_1016088, partial [Pleurotus ostreatus PC15]
VEDLWTYPEQTDITKPPNSSTLPEQDEVLRPHLLVAVSPKELLSWKRAYNEDSYYHDKGHSPESPNTPLTPSRFQRSDNGLLYFIDADWRYRLCVPKNKINIILNQIHNSPHEGAHSGKK